MLLGISDGTQQIEKHAHLLPQLYFKRGAEKLEKQHLMLIFYRPNNHECTLYLLFYH